MIASWGLLAFLKAADTRQNASFAIRLDKKGEFEQELEGGGMEDPEEIFRAVPKAAPKKHKNRRPAPDRRFEDTTVVSRSQRSKDKPIRYTDFSDEDFFESFERPAARPSQHSAGTAASPEHPAAQQPRPSAPARSRQPDSQSRRTPAERPSGSGRHDRNNPYAPYPDRNSGRDTDSRPLTLEDLFGDDDK